MVIKHLPFSRRKQFAYFVNTVKHWAKYLLLICYLIKSSLQSCKEVLYKFHSTGEEIEGGVAKQPAKNLATLVWQSRESSQRGADCQRLSQGYLPSFAE